MTEAGRAEQALIPPLERGAWSALRDRLRPFVARRVAEEADVDDVVQEIFLRMQRGLGELRDAQRFGPWVYRVARSVVADHHRARARQRAREHEAALQPAGPADDDGAPAASDALAQVIAPFVAMLPSPYREALTLTELQGLSQREAAKREGVSVSGMKSRVQRGRAQLRDALEACCDIELDARQRVVACAPRPDGRLPDGRPVRPC